MHSYLQTKAVSLALEAKYIRQQEIKFTRQAKLARWRGKDRNADWAERNRVGQYVHRVTAVREEARITNIARGFLKGLEYGKIERSAYSAPNWARIEKLVMLYGERDNPRYNQTIEERFIVWHHQAVEYFQENQLYALEELET